MKKISNNALFVAAIFAGMSMVLARPLYARLTRPPPARVSHLHANVAVSEQLRPEEIPELSERGFRTIVDLRPDGEAVGQASSAEMANAARAKGMRFVYAPVPHGAIPDSAVAALDEALTGNPSNILLYCRSGKRAARTWGLFEASRRDGMDGPSILAAIKASGQNADDLSQEIARRIAKRTAPMVATTK